MEAFLVIFTAVAFAFILKAVEYFAGNRKIKSVGAKSNKQSRNIPTIDITDQEELKKALDYYRKMED